MNGLRIGTPELVRWGVTPDNVDEIAALVVRGLNSNAPEGLAPEVAELRAQYAQMHYVLA